MNIGGFQGSSLIEYPNKLSAIVFTQGCNLKCPYCHNPELVSREAESEESVSEDYIFSFLDKRKEMLDAVCITGGEPLIQKDLIDFIKKIKERGYLIKLDSNGSYPELLEKILKSGLVDYVAMDVKAPFEKYQSVTNSKIDSEKIKKSIEVIMNSGLDYEFRTTIVKSQLNKEDILKIGNMIKGAKKYILQKFVPSKTLDETFMKEETYSDEEFEDIKDSLKDFVNECIVR